jgi:hypothetical protein
MTRITGVRSPSRSKGQALAEFAIVFPVFALLFFGLIDIGRYVYVANSLNQAAREGARYGSVVQWEPDCPAGVSPKDRLTCTQQVTLDRMVAIPGNVVATATCQEIGLDNTNNPPDADQDPDLVTVAAAQCGPLDLLTVTTGFDLNDDDPTKRFRLLTPIISDLVGAPRITGQAQVVVQ